MIRTLTLCQYRRDLLDANKEWQDGRHVAFCNGTKIEANQTETIYLKDMLKVNISEQNGEIVIERGKVDSRPEEFVYRQGSGEIADRGEYLYYFMGEIPDKPGIGLFINHNSGVPAELIIEEMEKYEPYRKVIP